jgi:hypothetical protein
VVLPSSIRQSVTLRGRRRTALLAAGALAVPMFLVSVPLSSARANVPGSSFEGGDGNLTVNTAGNTDWVNAPSFTPGIDLLSGKPDDAFSGGVSEDTVNPTVTHGAVPNSKDDLKRFYAGYETKGTTASPQELLYLAWIRAAKSQKDTQNYGSADMDFELNQSTSTTADGLPVRSDGDVLITYEFVSTHTPTLSLLRWRVGSNAACYTASSAPCWADRIALNSTTPPINSEGAVNDLTPSGGANTVPDPRPEAGTDKSLQAQRFGEAAIDLTAIGVFSSSSCTKFARVFAKSRSSQSFNSSLQDYISAQPINLSNCLTKSFDISTTAGIPTGTTLQAKYTFGGTVHTLTLSPAAPGHYTGSDAAIPPGTVLTNVHLELVTTSGHLAWSTTPGQTETISVDTTNTGTFSYAVVMNGPTNPENFVHSDGTPSTHTFTATVTGTGSLDASASPPPPTVAPLDGITVGWLLENTSPAGCATLSASSSTTSPSGQASVDVSSTRACKTTVRAFVDRAGSTAGYDTTGSGDPSDTGTKTWARYALSVTPANADNPEQVEHTFTVTLTKDTGLGPQPLSKQEVTVAIQDPNHVGAVITSVVQLKGTTLDPATDVCITNDSGQCTVKANETTAKAGTFSLKATYQASNQEGVLTFDNSGNKTYVNYDIAVSPTDVTNNVGDPEKFIVTVRKDTGGGLQAAGGVPVTLSLAPGTTLATITSVNPGSGSGTTGSCTTSAGPTPALGTCEVTIRGTQPGTAVLTASIDIALTSDGVANGQHIQRSATGTKHYVLFKISVSPLTKVNVIGDPHTFTILLTRDIGDGNGDQPYSGFVSPITLDQGGTDAQFVDSTGTRIGTTTSCTTSLSGTCQVTINTTASSAPGTVTLTAEFRKVLSNTSTADVKGTATKTYIALVFSKSACTPAAPVNGQITFTIPYGLTGGSLTGAKITDTLPAGLTYLSSGHDDPAVTVSQSGSVVVFTLPSPLTAGPIKNVYVTAVLQPTGPYTNTAVFTADGGITQTAYATVSTSNAGAGASGRAYGLDVKLAGSSLPGLPTPDVTTGHGELASLAVPPLAPTVASGNVGLLVVNNTPYIDSSTAYDHADATTAGVDLLVAGTVHIKATVVAARSSVDASGTNVTTTMDGSEVVGLTISGGLPAPGTPPLPTNATITDPTDFTVVNLLGQPLVQIHVLEQTQQQGAAAGVPQPTGSPSVFSSQLGVNGIRLDVLNGTAGVVVSHAEAFAKFPTLTPCAPASPFVIGSAFVASKTTTVSSPLPSADVTVKVVPVTLPSTGGNVSGALNATDLGLIGALSGTGTSSSQGSLSPLGAQADASVQSLLLPGLSLGLVQAHAWTAARQPSKLPSYCTSGVPCGSTTIANVVIGGTDVCSALGLKPTCEPPRNSPLLVIPTLLVMLNEQSLSQDGKVVTVNAIHIWVVGAGNPLGLPVGSDIVISGTKAGTGG